MNGSGHCLPGCCSVSSLLLLSRSWPRPPLFSLCMAGGSGRGGGDPCKSSPCHVAARRWELVAERRHPGWPSPAFSLGSGGGWKPRICILCRRKLQWRLKCGETGKGQKSSIGCETITNAPQSRILWSRAFNEGIYTSLTPAIRVQLMVISGLMPTLGERLRLLQSQRAFSINDPEFAPLASEPSPAGGAGDPGGFCSFFIPSRSGSS